MSDEVSQFLEQVERLRGQQIEEDEVRARELEEYLAAKRERQARREGEFPSQASFRCIEDGKLGRAAAFMRGTRRFWFSFSGGQLSSTWQT